MYLPVHIHMCTLIVVYSTCVFFDRFLGSRLLGSGEGFKSENVVGFLKIRV